MDDRQMKYETMIRKIFQCGRFEDPLGRLANTDQMIRKIFQCGRFEDPLGRLANTDHWYGLNSDEFSKSHVCKAWAILSRIKLQYLDSITGREEFDQEVSELEDDILNATTNDEIINVMNRLTEIVDELNLDEFPHISYKATNDLRI